MRLIVFLGCILLAASLVAEDRDLSQQRRSFLNAETALARDDMQRFGLLRRGLKQYPLYPYLRYAELSKKLRKAKATEVRLFLDAYADSPVSDRMRARWLNRLAGKGRWRDYLAFYTGSTNKRRRCWHAWALIKTNQKERAWPLIRKLWLTGRSLPRACNQPLASWRRHDQQTQSLVWQRVKLAMKSGNARLARYLKRYLSGPEKVWLDRWLRLRKEPRFALDRAAFDEPHPMRDTMLLHTLSRLSLRDADMARELWQQLSKRYEFSARQRSRILRRLTLTLSRTEEPDAWHFLVNMEPCHADSRLQEARIHAALWRRDWSQLIQWVRQLPAHRRESEQWRYWLARALEQTGKQQQAQHLYGGLVKERSYYGFLAADRLGRPYSLTHANTPVTKKAVRLLGRLPAMQRAHELLLLGRNREARAEWRWALRGANKARLRIAAELAQSWGWHDRAILALARTGYWDDLRLRFPLEHRTQVTRQAARHGLPSAWIYGVMRQESLFQHDARSPAGALGLMQLMPSTARRLARSAIGKRLRRRSQILDPIINIKLGSTYLKRLHQRFPDNPVLITASYNAGPRNVTRWLPETDMPADIWVELIPYKETRTYVRRVMTYRVIYDHRLGKKPVSLVKWMGTVPGRPRRTAGAS